MSSVTRPRGRLPRRVYWVRRLLVLGVALLLVLGVSRLLGGSGGGTDPQARPVGATASARTSPQPAPQPTPSASGLAASPAYPATSNGPSQGPSLGAGSAAPLAAPNGTCKDSDVQVTPSVDRPAYAAHDVVFTLNLNTRQSPACTWKVSWDTVMLKVVSGQDRIWSTQDCHRALPPQDVVVRNNAVTKVHVVWTGQRSDGTCSRTTPWAMPGSYHALAAVFGFDPVDTQFVLGVVPRKTVTKTPKPSPSPSVSLSGSPSGSPTRH